MDWNKIAPWNWFKEEDPAAAGVPDRGPVGQELVRPSLDISESKKAYSVRAELPGVERSDVSLDVKGHTLVIRAEKRREEEESEEGYHWVERSYGLAQRVLSLPTDADPDAIDARFKNGVLRLKIPKRSGRAARGRSIEIGKG
ncbi:MAG: Hsp20/alpha crystallin family protein [Deltaproteobacteria bacterium]|nr:Hsp20/alpha crystallin family protein [Deltaproteobacteria bacterium]